MDRLLIVNEHSAMSTCRPGLAETYPDLIAPTRMLLEATESHPPERRLKPLGLAPVVRVVPLQPHLARTICR